MNEYREDCSSTEIFAESCNDITGERRSTYSVNSPDGANNENTKRCSVDIFERSSVDIFERSSVDIFDGKRTGSNGITNRTRRAKSAHPRILTTPNTRNTNASYEQLLVSIYIFSCYLNPVQPDFHSLHLFTHTFRPQ